MLDDFSVRPRTTSGTPEDKVSAPPSPAKGKSKKRKTDEDVGAKGGEGGCMQTDGSLF